MAIYDGETVRIKATLIDFNDQPVGPTQVTSAKVSLYDSSFNYAFQNVDLTWNSVDSYWYYDWPAALPGTWKSICTFEGPGFEAFEYGTVRVKPLKFVPTGQPTTITGQEDDNGG